MTSLKPKVYTTFALVVGLALTGMAVGAGSATAAVAPVTTATKPPATWYAAPVAPPTAATTPAPVWYATTVAGAAAATTAPAGPPASPFLSPLHRPRPGHAGHRH
jgi:hypothetical protein